MTRSILVGWVLCCLSLPAVAQETEESTPSAGAAENNFVPPDEILREAESESLWLRRIEIARRSSTTLNSVRSSYERISPQTQEWLSQPELTRLDSLSRSELDEVIRSGQRLRGQLNGWSERLNQDAKELEATLARLKSAKEKWSTTAAVAGRYDLPEVALSRISSTLSALRLAESELLSHREQSYSLDDRITQSAIDIGEVLEEGQALRVSAVSWRIAEERRPLWRNTKSAQSGPQLDLSSLTLRESFRTFIGEYKDRIGLALVLGGVLTGLLLVVKRRLSARDPELSQEDSSTVIFKRPVAAALLLVLLAMDWIFPGAPVEVIELLGLLYVIPILALVIPSVSPRVKRFIVGLAVLYVADGLPSLAVSGSLLEQAAVILLGSVAFGLILWGLVVRIAEAIDRSHWRRAALVVARLALAVLAFSVGAATLGYVSLAHILISGVLQMSYSALILDTAARTIRVVIRGLFDYFVLPWSRAAKSYEHWLEVRLHFWIKVAAVVAWITATLFFFDLLSPVASWLQGVTDQEWVVGKVTISFGGILQAFLILFLTYRLSKFLGFLILEEISPRLSVPMGTARMVNWIIHYSLMVTAGFLALGATGVELSRLALVASALGVGIGIGLQGIVNNFVSGLILTFEQPIQVGDTIDLGQGQLKGRVRKIGARASTVRTFEGAEVIVPNSELVSKEVINWTLSDRLRRMEVTVGVAYGSDVHQVMELLSQAAQDHSQVLKSPEPTVLFLGFGDSSLDFSLRFWTRNYNDFLQVASDVTVQVHDVLHAHNITIPFPQRDVHLHSVENPAGPREGS